MNNIQSGASLALYASENLAHSQVNSSVSNQYLSKKKLNASNSLLNYLESSTNQNISSQNHINTTNSHYPPTPLLSSLIQQRKTMDYEENRKLYDQISFPLSPPSVTAISTTSATTTPLLKQSPFDDSLYSSSNNSSDGIDFQIQSLSKRIRERLQSPPQV